MEKIIIKIDLAETLEELRELMPSVLSGTNQDIRKNLIEWQERARIIEGSAL